MEKPPEWPLMAGEIAPTPSPVAVPREDDEPTAVITDGFVGTARIPPRAAATVRIPRPPVGVATAPAPPELPTVPIAPPPPARVLAPSSPAVPWSPSGPPARVVSGPPARGTGVAARLPYPGVERPSSGASPALPARPVKGLVIFVTIVVLVLGVGLTGYLWALPVYDQSHRALAVPSEVVGLPKVTDPTAYTADPFLAAARRTATETSVVIMYQATDDPAHRVVFVGGRHVVWVGVGGFLGQVFRGLRPALAKDSAMNPGPLGGVGRCAAGVVDGTPLTVCGWQDHGTIGLLAFSNRSPAEGAVLLRAMRPALEHPTD